MDFFRSMPMDSFNEHRPCTADRLNASNNLTQIVPHLWRLRELPALGHLHLVHQVLETRVLLPPVRPSCGGALR